MQRTLSISINIKNDNEEVMMLMQDVLLAKATAKEMVKEKARVVKVKEKVEKEVTEKETAKAAKAAKVAKAKAAMAEEEKVEALFLYDQLQLMLSAHCIVRKEDVLHVGSLDIILVTGTAQQHVKLQLRTCKLN